MTLDQWDKNERRTAVLNKVLDISDKPIWTIQPDDRYQVGPALGAIVHQDAMREMKGLDVDSPAPVPDCNHCNVDQWERYWSDVFSQYNPQTRLLRIEAQQKERGHWFSQAACMSRVRTTGVLAMCFACLCGFSLQISETSLQRSGVTSGDEFIDCSRRVLGKPVVADDTLYLAANKALRGPCGETRAEWLRRLGDRGVAVLDGDWMYLTSNARLSAGSDGLKSTRLAVSPTAGPWSGG